MEDHFLSRFTPSLMTPAALEAIFVQREKLLLEILERIRTSALSRQKKNTLLVGPRGIGKTHLISLINYRLQSMAAIQDRIAIAWLREEEWGIACYRDLLLRILRALVPEHAEDDERLAPVYTQDPSEAETAAVNLIKEIVGDRTLVLLVENLDDLVRKLGGPGETQFHNFLKHECASCTVATSPGPAARVVPAGSPFRKDFFEIRQLKGLELEDAIQLISRIAEYQKDQELLNLINTPRGRARVRALRYLAGGNHRAYVIFAPLLTYESIGKLIKPLMQTIDDLTPYYNSRISILPWEQRQILEYICEVRHPVSVGDVSRTCFLPRAAASAQLESLCALGHLQALQIGDNRYYELREPLMRLSFEVKKHRGKPIGLLLDFLRLWYSPAELKEKLTVLPAIGGVEHSYIPDVRLLEQDWDDPRIAECCRDYSEALKTGNDERALKAVEELTDLRGLKQDFMALAACFMRLDRHDRAVEILDRLTKSFEDDPEVWRMHAAALNRAGRFEEALSSCRKAIDLDAESGEALRCEASILLNLGRSAEAIHSCEEALRLSENDTPTWSMLGRALAELDLFEESYIAFSKAVELEPRNARAYVHVCAALIELNRWNEALSQIQHAIDLSPEQPEPWVLQGSVFAGMGKCEEALMSLNKAVSLGENSSYVRFKIVELLLESDNWREGAAELDRALAQFANTDDPKAGDTRTMIQGLLSSVNDPAVLQASIKVLSLIYKKHGMLDALAQGLIELIPDVATSARISDEEAARWEQAWRNTAEPFPEFRLALRLLDCAVRYRKSKDLSIFMNLPQEERTLLEALVGVHVEAIA